MKYIDIYILIFGFFIINVYGNCLDVPCGSLTIKGSANYGWKSIDNCNSNLSSSVNSKLKHSNNLAVIIGASVGGAAVAIFILTLILRKKYDPDSKPHSSDSKPHSNAKIKVKFVSPQPIELKSIEPTQPNSPNLQTNIVPARDSTTLAPYPGQLPRYSFGSESNNTIPDSELPKVKPELYPTPPLISTGPPSNLAISNVMPVPGPSELPKSISSRNLADVMISFHVNSMGGVARKLQEFLREHNYSTFVCLDLIAGDNFRTEIVKNAKACKFFILLINENYANSQEAEFEFNIALNDKLHSSVPGATKRFIPIIIGDFDKTQSSVVTMVLANAHAIFVKDVNELENTFKQILQVITNTQ